MYISLWENSRGHPNNVSFMQFSTKIDGFEQKDSQGFENSYNSYEQYPLEKFFIFTIYQNYTLALIVTTMLTNQNQNQVHQNYIFRPSQSISDSEHAVFTEQEACTTCGLQVKWKFVHPEAPTINLLLTQPQHTPVPHPQSPTVSQRIWQTGSWPLASGWCLVGRSDWCTVSLHLLSLWLFGPWPEKGTGELHQSVCICTTLMNEGQC